MSVNIQTIILGNVLAIAPADIAATGDYRRSLADDSAVKSGKI